MDYLLFSLSVLAAFSALQWWLRRRGHLESQPRSAWVTLLVLLLAGALFAHWQGEAVYARVRNMVEGFPPTYAQELERMGHARIEPGTAPDDARYQRMIDAQIRWIRVNPSIADIYTMRRLPDGRIALIVDSETDYDRDGRFEGEREQRTAIGEIYEKKLPALAAALAGRPAFMDEPYHDRWGHWVSAFVPMFDENGRVEAVCGVDYSADRWLGAMLAARREAMGIVLLIVVLLTAAGTVITVLESALRQRKQNEARVSQLNEQLEGRVLARTAELETAHRRLVEASHRAGMSEVATSVLHNVGNALNSLNVSTSTLAVHVHDLKSDRLRQISALLREHPPAAQNFFAPGNKGALIIDYLDQFAKFISDKREALAHETGALRRSMEHMRAVVDMQQGYARVRGVAEQLDLAALVGDCIALSEDLIRKHGIEIQRDFRLAVPVALERHKAMQIIVNLLRNACIACAESSRTPRSVIVALHEAQGSAIVEVHDTGDGIAAENLGKLFTRGFTTRKDGHGFGLHSAAIAARELGGTLAAASAGPGRGASFRLTVPLAPDTAASRPGRPAPPLVALACP